VSSRLTHVCPRARSAAPAGKKEMRFACSNCTNVCKAVVGTMSISVRLSLAVALCCLAPLKNDAVSVPHQCPHCKKINVCIACGSCATVFSCLRYSDRVKCPECLAVNLVGDA